MCTAVLTEKEKQEEKEKMDKIKMFIDSTKTKEYTESFLIEVLHKVQESYRYLRKDVLVKVAEFMNISKSRVWGVASFYNYFSLKPRGEYVISVCHGTACYVKGGENILTTIIEELGIEEGETTEDMMFTLLTVRCLGACAQSPVMMINGKIYNLLTTKKVRKILHQLRADEEEKEE